MKVARLVLMPMNKLMQVSTTYAVLGTWKKQIGTVARSGGSRETSRTDLEVERGGIHHRCDREAVEKQKQEESWKVVARHVGLGLKAEEYDQHDDGGNQVVDLRKNEDDGLGSGGGGTQSFRWSPRRRFV